VGIAHHQAQADNNQSAQQITTLCNFGFEILARRVMTTKQMNMGDAHLMTG
jgi:hypothetical protein